MDEDKVYVRGDLPRRGMSIVWLSKCDTDNDLHDFDLTLCGNAYIKPPYVPWLFLAEKGRKRSFSIFLTQSHPRGSSQAPL